MYSYLANIAETLAHHLSDHAFSFWKFSETMRGEFVNEIRNDCYATGQGAAVCERIANEAFDRLYGSLPTIAGVAVVSGWFAYSTVCAVRNSWREHQYGEYKNKGDADIQDITPGQQEAFRLGVRSANSIFYQGYSFCSFESWRHLNAFDAGFGTATKGDNELIVKVKNKQ